MAKKQHIYVSSITIRKSLWKLKQKLILANQCLLAKDQIIKGLSLDLNHLVDQLPKINYDINKRAINSRSC